MAKQKLDAVIEAVHLAPDGQIKWVRLYQRRGPTWSDRIIMERNDLIDFLKKGSKVYSGKRIEQMAGTFEVSKPVKLTQKNGLEIVCTDGAQSEKDRLEGVPLI